jgi:hypothetical protein
LSVINHEIIANKAHKKEYLSLLVISFSHFFKDIDVINKHITDVIQVINDQGQALSDN